jgi:RecA-family ATPase
VRSRAYLTTAKTERDEEPDPSLRTLEFKKSNYGPISTSIALRWQNGVYVRVAGIGSLDKLAAEQNADRLFVALLDRFNDQGRNVSEKAASKNYAPTIFAKEAEAKKYGIKRADLEGAMRRLFAASAISVQTYGAPCRGTTRLVTR